MGERAKVNWGGVLTVAFGLAMGLAVIAHVHGLDGPYYWKWKYTRLWPAGVYVGFALAASPLLIALALYEKLHVTVVLGAAVISTFLLRLVWMAVHSPGWDLSYLAYAVRHPWITSYYTDAAGLVNFPGWLENFDQVLGVLSVHSRNKPPGPILLCYAFINVLGDSPRTAIVVGVVLAGLQSLSVVATWFLLRVLSRDKNAAVLGACFLAMCPGYVLCFPMFDSLYILLVAPLVALWVLGMERDRVGWSIGAGLVLGLTSFMTFNFLVIGFFMLGCALLASGRRISTSLIVTLKHSLIVLATFAAANLLLYLTSDYNPLRTFASALEHQRYILTLPTVARPYPRTVLFDLTDFALGSAWIGSLLAGLWLAIALRSCPAARTTKIVVLGMAQLLVVAVTALLPGETARVWNFLYPLLMLPVGLQMVRFTPRMRWAIFATEFFILAALAQNMTFL